jgi:hypothetical protein
MGAGGGAVVAVGGGLLGLEVAAEAGDGHAAAEHLPGPETAVFGG